MFTSTDCVAWICSVNKRWYLPANSIARSLSEHAIYNVVIEYAISLGFGKIAPHDLRRTFAKLAHKGSSGVEQIQLSLGYSSIQTTECYLDVEQDPTDARVTTYG